MIAWPIVLIIGLLCGGAGYALYEWEQGSVRIFGRVDTEVCIIQHKCPIHTQGLYLTGSVRTWCWTRDMGEATVFAQNEAWMSGADRLPWKFLHREKKCWKQINLEGHRDA